MDLRRKNLVGNLIFPMQGDRVLLGFKTKKLTIGCWNGWGGGQKDGETIRQAAQRELEEESGFLARLEDLEYVGKVTFHNQKSGGREFHVEVHMFLVGKWEGELKPNAEMKNPTWWPINSFPPISELMPSDPDWLPLVLRGVRIDGDAWQKWIEEPGKPVRVVKTKLSEIRKVEKLGDVD